MHEYGLVGDLLSRIGEIAREHGAASVVRVQVKLGALCGVEPELFRTAFDTFKERTVCAAAELVVHDSPPRFRCTQCGSDLAPPAARCCSRPGQLVSGDELLLERVELERA